MVLAIDIFSSRALVRVDMEGAFSGLETTADQLMYVADKLDLGTDTKYNTTVTQTTCNDNDSRCTVRTQAGEVFRVMYMLLNVRFVAKRYIPDYRGLDSFKGRWMHPAY